ncbi:class F sortase [Xylanimonas protaetiae]|uniref:class F sortase n=1 Tax=Xylanimonas protaetiae TaxID=2509457 RepID=UPI0013EDFCE1|nr:class F sortase [Xylanimonas protaetiae]
MTLAALLALTVSALSASAPFDLASSGSDVAVEVPDPAPVATPEPEPEVEAPLVVPAATPVRVLIPAIGVDAPIEVYTDAMVAAADGWIDPTTHDVVSWWQGGGTPSSDPDNTVYLYGHVSRLEAVFNYLHSVVPGTEVTVVTEAGEIVYVVQEVLEPVGKEALPDDPRINAQVPGRLVLIGCYREPDQGRRRTTHNIVVIAHQVDSAK